MGVTVKNAKVLVLKKGTQGWFHYSDGMCGKNESVSAWQLLAIKVFFLNKRLLYSWLVTE